MQQDILFGDVGGKLRIESFKMVRLDIPNGVWKWDI